jgi:hypothetical protein
LTLLAQQQFLGANKYINFKSKLAFSFYYFQQSIAPDLLYEARTNKLLTARPIKRLFEFLVGVFFNPTHSTDPLVKIGILLRSVGGP